MKMNTNNEFTEIFKNIFSSTELKNYYRSLVMIHHPDRGGDTAKMQELNDAYFRFLKLLDGKEEKGQDDKYHKYSFNETYEKELSEKIYKFFSYSIGQCCKLYVAGSWLWAIGETKPIKDKLKNDGWRWSHKKEAWYFHAEPYRKFGKKEYSLYDIANLYGLSELKRSVTKGIN